MAKITGKPGNYAVRFWYRDVFGKQKSKYKSGFKTRKEAQEWADKTLEELKGGYSKNLTFADVANTWYDLKVHLDLSPETLDYYRRYKDALINIFGQLDIKQVNDDVIQEFIKQNKDSIHVLEQKIKVLSCIINYSLKKRYIKENPLSFVEFPKGYKDHPQKTSNNYTFEEAIALIKKLYEINSKLITPCLLSLMFGLRRAEVCALKWEDVGELIRITKGYVKGQERRPKSTRSVRDFEIEQSTYDLLRDFQTRNKIESEYVCCNLDGTRLKPYELTHKFTSFIEKHALKKITFHNLRHLFSNFLRDNGETMDIISRAMGHSSIEVTEKHYLEDNQRLKNQAVKKLQNQFVSKATTILPQ
jgi:integrase